MKVVYSYITPNLYTLNAKIHEYHQNVTADKKWMIINYIGNVIRKTDRKYQVQLTHVVNGCNLDTLDPPLIRMVNQIKCEEIKGLNL